MHASQQLSETVGAMEGLSATFRLLYSGQASFESKLEAAERLVSLLLGSPSAAAPGKDVAGLPPLVRGHYVRSLLEWSCSVLSKKGSAPAAGAGEAGSHKEKKQRQMERKWDAPAGLQPRCWAVLTAVLGSSSIAASQQLPAALLPAATDVLQALHGDRLADPGVQGELLSQLAALLHLLHGKFAASFRPGIEHAAAAAEAALTGLALSAGQAPQGRWAGVAAGTVRLLLVTASGHPNQRKVWDAAVPRLLPPLVQAAFPADSDSNAELSDCCRRLLSALLFNQQHVAALAAAAAAEMAAATEASEAAGTQAQSDKEAANGTQRLSSTYAAQLFKQLQEQVEAGSLPHALLPWLAGQFCTALHQYRRAAETEAAITSQAGNRSQQQQAQEAGDMEEGDATLMPSQPQNAGQPPGAGGISVSADFHFWAALLRVLLPRVHQLQQQEDEQAGRSRLASTLSGVALLAEVLHCHQLYRPTQDPAGLHRRLLQQLADTALLLAQQGQENAGVVPSALGVLRGILAVEHRVIQQQLPLLWPLLLCPPATSAPADRQDSSNTDVAVAVACSLVAAFAELRQLEVLLQSLTDALQQLQGDADVAPDAAAVLRSGQFTAALSAAVRQLPSGQVPMVPRLAAAALEQLAGSSGKQAGQLLLAAGMYCCCLGALRVDLTTAPAAAAAAQALVAALAPVLLPLLGALGASGSSGSKEEHRREKKGAQAHASILPSLLRLYHRALALHAHCAALHPEVEPLPGQHVRQQPGGRDGYFAPLLQGRQGQRDASAASALQVAALLRAADGSSSLHMALLEAAEQQLQVLHQQHQYLSYTCPVTLLREEGAAEQAAEAQASSHQQWDIQDEARQLAAAILSAAAEQAASSSGTSGAAVQVALGALPMLQEWAPDAQLQAFLQACLRQAATGCGSNSMLCRQLFQSGEVLEQARVVPQLPAAAAAVLVTLIRDGFGAKAAATANEDPAEDSKSKKRKKKEQGQENSALGGSGGGAQLAALLEQLERLARGKAPKGKAWAAAVEASCSKIAELAAGVGDAQKSGSSKKRKLGAAAAGSFSGDAVGDSSKACSALLALQQLAGQLACLPLDSLPSEAAASMAAVAVGGLLCCWQGFLASLTEVGAPTSLAQQAVGAGNAFLALLAAQAGNKGGGLSSQQHYVAEVVQAVLTAAGSVVLSVHIASLEADDLHAAAALSCHVMTAVCYAHLAAGDSFSLQQLVQKISKRLSAAAPPPQQWGAAVVAQACLSACCAAVGGSSGGRLSAAADILCPAGREEQQLADAAAGVVGSVAAQVDGAIAAALLLAAPAGGAWSGGLPSKFATCSLYHCAALLLRLRCCDHPAVDAFEQQMTAGDGRTTCLSTLTAGLQAAAALLAKGAAPGALEASLVQYVAAACCLTGRMRPTASSSHYAGLLALLLRLLAARQPSGAAEAASLPPTRHTIPFAAAFPAAAAAVDGSSSGDSSPSSALRPLLLEALRELLAGSSSQQLLLPLRYVEAALPASAGPSSRMALPLCELLLALLEAGSGGSQRQRLLGQHSERLAGLLTTFIDTVAYASSTPCKQGELPSMQQLAAAILAAGEGRGGGSGAAGASIAAPLTPSSPAGDPPALAAPAAAEVAALCTALRALESLAARPKLFPLAPAAASSMLSSITALWAAYAEHSPQQLWQPGALAAAPLPGFRYRLGTAGGAALFSASCHLLLAMLRHRQQALRRCIPLLLQAVSPLLRFLAAAELSAKLQRLPALSRAAVDVQREQGWRVSCAELLAAVMAELAGLKEAGIGRYLPHLLADYILLAAAPPSAKSRALLHFSSPTAAAIAGAAPTPSGSIGTAVAAAAMAAEEDVLAGEPLSAEVAIALAPGAFALYGACSSAEVQYLYASLGASAAGTAQRGTGTAASWRAALSALKAEYEKSGKYTGKV